jgi:hypothetical protein
MAPFTRQASSAVRRQAVERLPKLTVRPRRAPPVHLSFAKEQSVHTHRAGRTASVPIPAISYQRVSILGRPWFGRSPRSSPAFHAQAPATLTSVRLADPPCR